MMTALDFNSLDIPGLLNFNQTSSGGSDPLITYRGTYNGATNTPNLTNGVGDTGDFYYTTVAGNAGPAGQVNVGDIVIYDGFVWENAGGINNSDEIIVASSYIVINGQTVQAGQSLTYALGALQGQINTLSAGSVASIGAIDSQAASANGASISGSSLYMQSASATAPGLVNTSTQTIAGVKTFSDGIVGSLTGSATRIGTVNEVVASANYYPVFVADSATNTSQVPRTDGGLRYNPQTNTFFADVVQGVTASFSTSVTSPSFIGNASTATTATNAGTANVATNVATTATATNATYYLTFVSATSGNLAIRADADIKYNPSTNTFSCPTIIATTDLTVTGATANLPFQVISSSAQSNNGYYGMSIEKDDGVNDQLAGNQVGTLNFRGRRGGTVGTSGRITLWAGTNWTLTDIGSYFTFDITPNGTTTRTTVLQLGNISGSNINSQFFGSVTATGFVGNLTGNASSATNVAGGAANQIVYNTGAGASSFITAPTVSNTFLEWNGSAFVWTAADPDDGVTTVGTFDSKTPSANGAVIDGVDIVFQSASATLPGMVNTTTQTFAGQKTFSTGITGDLTGTASGNTTYTANQYGVVVSGATNAMTVIAPDADTTKYLKSGGLSADPAWDVIEQSEINYPVRTTNGSFDAAVYFQYCNTDQSIAVADMILKQDYSIYANGSNITITFTGTFTYIGGSGTFTGTTQVIPSGSVFTFKKIASNIIALMY